MDGSTTAILVLLAVLCLALVGVVIAVVVVYVKRVGTMDDLKDKVCELSGLLLVSKEETAAASREVEYLKVQLEAAKKGAEAASKTPTELVNDATTSHPPSGPLAGSAEPG